MHQHVAFVNRSTVVPAAEFEAGVAALRIFAEHHVSVAWGRRAPEVEAFASPPGGRWAPIVVVDEDKDVPGALGFHDEDPKSGPYGDVLAKTCRDHGVSWQSCAAHELAELLGDEYVDDWTNDEIGWLWATELCDPVESNVYSIGGVEMSDFVLPSWFDINGKAPFSFMDLMRLHGAPGLTRPFEVAAGGYAIVSKSWPNVTQIFANGDETPDASYPAWKVLGLKVRTGARSLRRHDLST